MSRSLRRVGLIAPSSAPSDAKAVDRGVAYLEQRGLVIATHRPNFSQLGYLAGTDTDRVDELNRFLRSPDVDGIVCVRGGYGALRILDHIDYDAARRNPKPVIGYSDITAIQLALLSQSDVKSISGPMVGVEFSGSHADQQSFFWELLDITPPYAVRNADDSEMNSVVNGTCEGRLVGGNLAVLTRLVGTPYLPDMNGAILFIEDVGESPYRIDGMFAQLKLAGVLDAVGGIIVGDFSDADPLPGKPSQSLDEVLEHFLTPLGIPVATGLCYGHFPVKNAIPIGVQARFTVNTDTVSLTLLESVWPQTA